MSHGQVGYEKILKVSRIKLPSDMLLNPIPSVTDTDFYLLYYVFFSVIAIPAIIFILGTILTLKYSSHKEITGKIFVAMGTVELLPYVFSVFHTFMVNLYYLLYNYWIFVFILGCITLTGGAAILKKVKRIWMFFLIIAAIIVIIWAFDALFIIRY